jgi:hypothetical protein
MSPYHVRVRVGCQRLLEMSPLAGVREVLDEFRRGGEQSLEAVLDGSVPDGLQRSEVTSCNFTAPIATFGAQRNPQEVLLHPNRTQIFSG